MNDLLLMLYFADIANWFSAIISVFGLLFSILGAGMFLIHEAEDRPIKTKKFGTLGRNIFISGAVCLLLAISIPSK